LSVTCQCCHRLLCSSTAGHEREEGRRDPDPDPYVQADKLFRDILEARTFSQLQAVIQDAASVNPYEDTPLSPLVLSLAPPTLQPQLNIRPGASAGILTQSEYEEKLKREYLIASFE
jgi:hypothetical protein